VVGKGPLSLWNGHPADDRGHPEEAVSLDTLDVVDFVGIEDATGTAVLTIADAWDWSDEGAHLAALQAKIYRYLDFVESGQLVETEPNATGLPVRIDVIARFPVSARGQKFFADVGGYTESQGVGLEYRLLPSSA
jgi:hypothetical protein